MAQSKTQGVDNVSSKLLDGLFSFLLVAAIKPEIHLKILGAPASQQNLLNSDGWYIGYYAEIDFIQVKGGYHEEKERRKNIKIREDLAPGIKRMFNQVSVNRSSLNIESVWTIDGRIRY